MAVLLWDGPRKLSWLGMGWRGAMLYEARCFSPNCTVSQWCPVPRAGSPLTTAALSTQVLTVLLVLTAVAELVLAFLEDMGLDSPPAVRYTNPSLYMVTWVSASWTLSPERRDVTAGTGSKKLPLHRDGGKLPLQGNSWGDG